MLAFPLVVVGLFPMCTPAARHLLVLAGQSNMQGYAPHAGAGLPDSIPGVLVWNAIGHRAGVWGALAPGSSLDSNCFGPEMTLVRRLKDVLPADTFAVVKVAFGGTSLERHWLSPSSGDVVGYMFDTLIVSLEAARSRHPLGEFPLSGFFWMQGESDALTEASATAYGSRLEALLLDLRTTWSDTSMPWILAQIDVQPAWPWADLVREGTSDAASALERTSLVETAGLPTDGAHLTAEGSKRLGIRFADQWLAQKDLLPPSEDRKVREIRRIEGGRLLITHTGPDPILQARMVSLDGRASAWSEFRHSVIFTRPPGRNGVRRGFAVLQVRRLSERMESFRVAWP